MLSMEFGGQEVLLFPFGKHQREKVGNDPTIEVYLTDEENNLMKADPGAYEISRTEHHRVFSFKEKKTGLIRLS